MENLSNLQNPDRDPQLWEIAKRRASFKYHLVIYILGISFLWGVWFFSGNQWNAGNGKYPWPVWPMGGWGIGLVFHYLGAYVFPEERGAEKEYEKLVRNKKNQ